VAPSGSTIRPRSIRSEGERGMVPVKRPSPSRIHAHSRWWTPPPASSTRVGSAESGSASAIPATPEGGGLRGGSTGGTDDELPAASIRGGRDAPGGGDATRDGEPTRDGDTDPPHDATSTAHPTAQATRRLIRRLPASSEPVKFRLPQLRDARFSPSSDFSTAHDTAYGVSLAPQPGGPNRRNIAPQPGGPTPIRTISA
jgi:hypothetical protein